MFHTSFKLIDGEYVKDGDGRLITVEYIEALLQNVCLIIGTQRGKFYPDKNFGSRLSTDIKEPFEEYAQTYIRQAIYGLDGVFVKKVRRNGNGITVILIINDEEKEVTLPFEENI